MPQITHIAANSSSPRRDITTSNLGFQRGLPYSPLESPTQAWLDWPKDQVLLPPLSGGNATKRVSAIPVALLFALVAAATASGAGGGVPDVRVSSGSPPTPFSQNKQNEPTITADAHATNILVAGSNDEIDMEDCNNGNPVTCPFTQGVGVSGVYFSFDSGKTWTQPTYTGWSARTCVGVVGPDSGCQPVAGGSIGTLPWYYENGLVSDGDPAVAFGPRPDSN